MNHARARARAVVAQLRRQRPVAPQGDPGLNDLETPSYAVPAVDQACKRCGYLCCNCYTFTVPNIVVDARVPRGTAMLVIQEPTVFAPEDTADEYEHALLRSAGWVPEPLNGLTDERWLHKSLDYVLREHNDGWYVYGAHDGELYSKLPSRRAAMRALGFTFANDPAVPTPKFRAGDMVRILPSAIAVGIDRAHVGRETEVLKTGHTGECSIHIVKPDNPGDIWVARPMDLELVGF